MRGQRDHLENTAELLTTRLTQLGMQLEDEQAKNRRAWRENCERVQALDAELAEREAELAARDANPQQYSPHSSTHNDLHVPSRSSSPSPSLSSSVSRSVVPSLPELSSLLQQRDSAQLPDPPNSRSLQVPPHLSALQQPVVETQPDDRRRRRRGRAPPVEPYTGENKEQQLEDWLPTLERAGQWNDRTPEELLLQLAGHLRGRALQEWNLMSQSVKSSWKEAVQGLRSRLEPGTRSFAAQDFRHLTQAQGETVSDFLCRLERTFQLAYGRDPMSAETRSTLLYCQLQEVELFIDEESGSLWSKGLC